MSGFLRRPTNLSVWGSLFCLSFACSEESPGPAGGVDPSTSVASSTGSSSQSATSSPTSAVATSNGGAASQATSNATQTSGNTNGQASTSGSTQTSATTTSEPPTNATTTVGGSTNETTTSATGSSGELSSEVGASSGDSTSETNNGTQTSAGAESASSSEVTSEGATSAGGTVPDGDCTPNPSGGFVTEGEVVFDAKTCLSWMKSDVTGHPYAAADTYCADLSLGGHDDWRLPTAGEATTLFHCEGTFPPVYDVFTAMYDGIWTTTETGTIAGDEPKVCGAGQASGQFYDFGKVGAQNTRCVRGPVTLPDREDCKTNNQVCQ